ncbi:nuclear transport factor 2 family protein [Rhodococcus sp. LB1]|uniref:nuclear transport factor 2 family protein n=1 Tax=Rhodococcus sp. LB1 TaxID=1807499 RepID=UPI00077A5BCD|nr:hypothetical protein [Rhodococcus sp. LB1]KXX58965.1 hypothetical protein AZG88_43360 [Rhodococcus sp. LB1]
MTEEVNLALDYLRSYADLDFAGALALSAESASFQFPDGNVADKQTAIQLLQGLASSFAGPIDLQVTGVTSEVGRVAVEATAEVPLPGEIVYRNQYHYLFEITDAQIIAVREYCSQPTG